MLLLVKTKPLFFLLILVFILRIPYFFEPYWYGDEAIYLTLGEGLRKGLVLYRDIFDHKPPLIYILAYIAGSLFWFKFILFITNIASLFVFWKFTEIIFKKNTKAVILSSYIFGLLTTLPFLEGNLVNSEILMILPTVAGFVLLFLPKPSFFRLFASGVLFSLNVLLKVPGIFDVGAFFAFWLFIVSSRRDFILLLRRSWVVLIGFLVPILVSLVYFASQDAFWEYVDVAGLKNFSYIASWKTAEASVSLVSTLSQAGLAVRSVVFVALVVLIFVFKRFLSREMLFSCLWFIFALFAALLSGRPYPHYLIQVVPSLSLLLGFVFFGPLTRRFWPVPLLLVFGFSLVFYGFYYYPTPSYYQNFISFSLKQKTKWEYFESFDARVPTIYKLADLINSRTSRSEPLFIWGTAPELYALSRRVPPGRFVTSFHVGDFAGYAETMEAIRAKKPKYIIVFKNEKREFDEFFDFLSQNYIYMETIGNATVWKLISPGLIQALSI